MTEADLLALLKRRIEPGALVLAHVTFGIRVADAISIGLWQSRGLLLEAYEMKCQRRDWLMEMRDPAKAEPSAAYMDRFWLVISEDKIALDEEVPEPWGILVARHGKLFTRRKAQPLNPKPVDRRLLTNLLRRATYDREQSDQELAIKQAEDRGYKRGLDAGVRQEADRHSYERQRHSDLKEAVEHFTAETGLTLASRWQAEETVRVARWLLSRDLEGGAAVRGALRQLVSAQERLGEALATLPADLLP